MDTIPRFLLRHLASQVHPGEPSRAALSLLMNGQKGYQPPRRSGVMASKKNRLAH